MDAPGLTVLLRRAQEGDADAADALFRESYQMLAQLARARLRRHVRTPTLDTSSLVHEAYLRFVSSGRLTIEDGTHFKRWAGRAMRSVIVDIARRRLAERRGGRAEHLTFTGNLPVPDSGGDAFVVRVHEALDALALVDARAAEVVQLRYFAGMTEPEVAETLGIGERTVRRDWEKARLLLAELLR